MEELCFTRSDKALSFPIRNGIYIHNIEKDTFFSIEEGVGTALWENCDGSKLVKEVIIELMSEFKDCKYEDIKDDVFEFLNELKNEGLVELVIKIE